MNEMSNQELMLKMRSFKTKDNELAFKYLYESMYSKTVNFVRMNSGREEEASDIFQDALFVFYKMVKEDRLQENTNPGAYIFTVFRNLWYKRLEKKKRNVPLESLKIDKPAEDDLLKEILEKEEHSLLNDAIRLLGTSCQEVLIAYYYKELSMKEIMSMYDYSSVQIVKNKKYKCMKKLRDLIQDSDYFE